MPFWQQVMQTAYSIQNKLRKRACLVQNGGLLDMSVQQYVSIYHFNSVFLNRLDTTALFNRTRLCATQGKHILKQGVLQLPRVKMPYITS